MFQVGDMVAMAWPASRPLIGLEQYSWSYGVVTRIESSTINVLWFHNDVDVIYRTSYALTHFLKRTENNGKG